MENLIRNMSMDNESSSSAKRLKTHHEAASSVANGHAVTVGNVHLDAGDEELRAFVEWCLSEPAPCSVSSKVHMGRMGSCARYGMSAREEIAEGEELFRVPRHKTLQWENIPPLLALRSEMEKLALESRWAPTIVSLLMEASKPPRESPWYPYLHLFLHQSTLDLPFFWDRSTQERLLGNSALTQRIDDDRRKMESDVEKHIVPLMRKVRPLADSELAGVMEKVSKISGFIMAYSFTRPEGDEQASTLDKENSDSEDEGQREATLVGNALAEVPIMVPIADFLNASVRRNNAKLHWDDEGEWLRMLAVKAISKGEEIFNTYGEISSSELLYLYGYAEDDEENPFEEVFLSSALLHDSLSELIDEHSLPIPRTRADLDKRWTYLTKEELVGEKFPVVLGRKEVLTDMEVCRILEVLNVDSEAFSALEAANDGEEEEPDYDKEQYQLENLSKLDGVTKNIFARVLQKKLKEYPRNLPAERKHVEEIKEMISKQSASGNVDVDLQRSLYVAFVRRAELALLSDYLRNVSELNVAR